MLLDYLSKISDHRRKQGQLYKLPDVLLFSNFSGIMWCDYRKSNVSLEPIESGLMKYLVSNGSVLQVIFLSDTSSKAWKKIK